MENSFMADKPLLESSRRMRVRDWLSISRNNNVWKYKRDSSLPIDRESASYSAEAVGVKRHKSDPSSPTPNKSISNGSTNEHFVYACRKFETEHGRPNNSLHVATDDSVRSKSTSLGDKQQTNDLYEEAELPKISSFSVSKSACGEVVKVPIFSTFQPTYGIPTISFMDPLAYHSTRKPVTAFVVAGSDETTIAGASSILVNHHKTSNLHWKDRFLRVQAFLKACDESSQEDYIQMLRSLSPVDRSKHAVALEKRAIHLLLEEGKELHLMKVLNVFGKTSPINQTTVSVDKLSILQVANE